MPPSIICVAISGSLPRKADNPEVPISIPEQVESTQEASEAGATIVHCHVRGDEGRPTSDPERFGRLKEGIERHCPGMIVQLSTGGRSGAGRARGGMLPLRTDMASLTAGSNNFLTRVYENPPDLVNWLAEEMRAHDVKPEGPLRAGGGPRRGGAGKHGQGDRHRSRGREHRRSSRIRVGRARLGAAALSVG